MVEFEEVDRSCDELEQELVMVFAPKWKVYNPQGEYVASCKHTEDAACLVAFYGEGATVRYDHTLVVWTEHEGEASASNSYDAAAETMRNEVLVKYSQKKPREGSR